jgi:hypothetical protein
MLIAGGWLAMQMNQTLDYSFENTPVSSQQANGSQVPSLPWRQLTLNIALNHVALDIGRNATLKTCPASTASMHLPS